MDAPAVTVSGTRIGTVHRTGQVTEREQGGIGRVAEGPFTSRGYALVRIVMR
jgi:hypothetical protein